VIEPNLTAQADRGPYQEIAVYVRELLRCDYALVALLDKDSLRIQSFAGGQDETSGSLATDLITRLREWEPVVVDEGRLIAAPVSHGGRVIGVLIGFSSRPATFSTDDLKMLIDYTPVAAGVMANAALEERAETKRNFTIDELRDFFRLTTLGEFSACFAHEVRNPLMLIRGNLRFVDESLELDHPLRARFEAIDHAATRIEEMAKRILDFSRTRSRRPEPCDVGELIADALRFVQPYVRTKFIDVQVNLDPHALIVDAERWQIVQAIVNLLQNAADAMASVDRRVLSISSGIEQNRLQITVSDTGTGIPPATRSRVFEPFFTTKGDRGTGLGLYITKQVVEEHGGTVSVQTGNGGTSFVISLPL